MDRSPRDCSDVRRLCATSILIRLTRAASWEGSSTSLLLATRKLFSDFNCANSCGRAFNLLNDKSNSSRFPREPISGGIHLHKKMLNFPPARITEHEPLKNLYEET
jgi:hypothetical protein